MNPKGTWYDVLCELKLWSNDPESVADENIDPPTKEVIRAACRLALRMQTAGKELMCVVPDGEGGIGFERGNAEYYTCIEIGKESPELPTVKEFRDCKLTKRGTLEEWLKE